MTWFKRFLQLLLTTGLTVLLSTMALLQIVGSGIALNQMVKDTGFYGMGATQIGDSLKSSSKVPVAYQTQFSAAIDKALTAEEVEAIVKPALVDIATWLVASGETEVPNVILNIKPAKDKLILEMKSTSISPAELITLQNELSTQIPDQITLSSLGSLTGGGDSDSNAMPSGNGASMGAIPTLAPGPGASTPTPSATSSSSNETEQQTDQVVATLKQVKQIVSLVSLAYWISIAVVVVSLGSLLWFGRADGRKWLRRPGYAAIVSSGLFVILALAIPFLMPAKDSMMTSTSSPSVIVPLVANTFLQAALLPSALVFLIGLALVFGAFFIRPKTSSMASITQLPYRTK